MTSSRNDMELDSAVYKTLLESTNAIPWRIDWKTMQFTYIGPQIEALLGWTPESWVSVEDWATRMHTEDRDQAVNFCVSQSKFGIDHEVDYRALTKSGDFVWIRDVVHVVREGGEVTALVGFMFDISERKAQEEAMLRMQRELEEWSFKDGLTQVANRRMFEQTLEREWASARRNSQPLSVILADIDFFKQYNDRYGHLAGDECLRRVAGLLGSMASRPRDVLARFGGEEFVLLLPETDAASASALAEKCRLLILDARIPHDQSAVAANVSVSMGASTIVPNENASHSAFIAFVDKLLYEAKQQGRNRVRCEFPGEEAFKATVN